MEQMDMFGGSTPVAPTPEQPSEPEPVAVQLGLAVDVPVRVKLGRVKVNQDSILA